MPLLLQARITSVSFEEARYRHYRARQRSGGALQKAAAQVRQGRRRRSTRTRPRRRGASSRARWRRSSRFMPWSGPSTRGGASRRGRRRLRACPRGRRRTGLRTRPSTTRAPWIWARAWRSASWMIRKRGRGCASGPRSRSDRRRPRCRRSPRISWSWRTRRRHRLPQ